MNKIWLFQVKGVMDMWVLQIWSICVLELKIFGGHYVAFGAQKPFLALHLQQKSLKSMKEWTKYVFSKWRGSLGMWVWTYDQFAFWSLRSWTSLCYLWSSKRFFSPSLGTSNATKIIIINEGMNKICLFQVKGSWACEFTRMTNLCSKA
jgi:hypothetical protein